MEGELRQIKTDKYTIKSGHIDVGHGHKVYYEQWGNKNVKTPILTFHGGPGGQYKPSYRTAFDPNKHQVIFFDQRGCGNSLPYGRWHHNKTQDLIEDAKKIIDTLKIKRVYLAGGSWGSTLALLFNISYPDVVAATLIRGVFTATSAEINYLDSGQFQKFYPEIWDSFVASVPQSHHNNPAAYHYSQLKSKDQARVIESAKAFDALERPLLNFDWEGPIPDWRADSGINDPYDYVPYQIYGHYLESNCFLSQNFILNQASKINNPVYIVQGRYDMVCPPVTAYRLHQQLVNSYLYMTLASHGNDSENRNLYRSIIESTFTN